MNRRKAIFLVALLVIVAAMGYWIYGNFTQMIAKYTKMGELYGQGGAVKVVAARCQRQDLTEYHDFTGTTEAVDSIEVRARVEGYLQEIHFVDGSLVEKGQKLFTIEPTIYMARREEAAFRLKAAQAELERARLDFERIQEAVKINAVSRQDLSRSQAAFQTSQAVLAEANSALERAELELSYTQIHSPISGKIGRHLIDAGNLVSSGGMEKSLLTTVVQIEPIYVFFYVNEQLLEKALLKGVLLVDSADASLPFKAGLSAESDYRYEGRIRYIDNRVDPMTGTIYVRGELSNEDRSLLPGMFMRVRVPGQVYENAIMVHEEAIITDLNGKYLLVIGENNILQRRNIKLGMRAGIRRQVTEGLTGDEAYVLSGLTNARHGVTVDPQFGPLPADAPSEETANPTGIREEGGSQQ